jgi:hypothetical protein
VSQPSAAGADRPEATDRLLPFSIDFRRSEVELFEADGYAGRETPPFVDAFVRSDGAGVVTTDLVAYLDWFAPLADRLRDRPALHIFMVNRCGSTLLLNALSRISGIVGLNELDPWPTDDPGASPRVRQIDDALGAHVRHWADRTGRRPLLKHRAEMIGAAGRLLGGFPAARAIFLIRHPAAVISSLMTAPPGSFPGPILADIEQRSPTLLEWTPELRAELHAAFYVDTVARYRALAASPLGAAIRCLRYETLVRDPIGAVTAVADFFGLEVRGELDEVRGELAWDARERAAGRQSGFAAPSPGRALAPRLRPVVEGALERAWTTPMPGELVV